MKYIGEKAIKKLISLIKGDLATKQDSIAATGVLERDTTGVINGVETVGATLVETQEATLVDVPNGLLKGDGTTISAAVAGTDYVNSNQAIRYDAAQSLTDAQRQQARSNIRAGNADKALSFAITLTAAGWSGNAQTVSNSNFAASGYAYTVAPASSSFAAYTSAVIYADDVTTAGEMNFHCGETPTEDLAVNILRTEASA